MIVFELVNFNIEIILKSTRFQCRERISAQYIGIHRGIAQVPA